MPARTTRFATAIVAAAALTAACAGNGSGPDATSAPGAPSSSPASSPASVPATEPPHQSSSPDATGEAETGGPEQSGPPLADHTTQRSLTFIALAGEDDGATGPSSTRIGCGDSAVPVSVATTTIAPLGEVYRAQLTDHDRTYGDTGLYNALYRSDLTYDSADITDGHATVKLTGDLLMGGECDIPRVRAQLTRPALQFDNVDAVTVLINGEPLDEVLSLRN